MASLICPFHQLTFLDIGQIIVRVRAFTKQKVDKEGNQDRLSQQCICGSFAVWRRLNG